MGEYLLTTPLPEQRNTGENLLVFCRVGPANGSSFMGFLLTGHWQNASAQAWWKFLRQEALVKLFVSLDFRLSGYVFFGAAISLVQNSGPNWQALVTDIAKETWTG